MRVAMATPVAQEMMGMHATASRAVAALLPFFNGRKWLSPHVARTHDGEREGDALWTAGYTALFIRRCR